MLMFVSNIDRHTVSTVWFWTETLLILMFQTVRRDFIIPVNKERREMVGNVILYFSTLAAAFRLKSPLPPYLPPAEDSRQRLVSSSLICPNAAGK